MSAYESWKVEFLKTVLSHPHNAKLEQLEQLSVCDCINTACRAATTLNAANIVETYHDVSERFLERTSAEILNALSSYFPPNTEFHFTSEPLGAPVEIILDGTKHVIPYDY